MGMGPGINQYSWTTSPAPREERRRSFPRLLRPNRTSPTRPGPIRSTDRAYTVSPKREERTLPRSWTSFSPCCAGRHSYKYVRVHTQHNTKRLVNYLGAVGWAAVAPWTSVNFLRVGILFGKSCVCEGERYPRARARGYLSECVCTSS